MRSEFEKILKEELRFLAIDTRERLNITQKEMGRKLEMSESSYSDIETGRCMCSTLTTVLLLDMQEDADEALRRIIGEFAKLYEKEMQSA